MREAPAFAAFYRAVHDREPFPWQARLAAQVAEQGWPTEIGVPTGLGKTAAIDIAVWTLALQADRNPAERTAPTRIWYVVNRRLLVDAGSDHAQRLASFLANPSQLHAEGREAGDIEAVAVVAERLASMPATRHPDGPLFVSRLRGGLRVGERPPEPSHPAVICATVPMFGSRLLFRSYGAGHLMWPVDAALAGIDSLVLLDEAHLAGPLQRLVRLLPDCDANRTGILRVAGRAPVTDGPARLLPAARAYPVLVSLTATGQGGEGRFDLDDADRAHPIVRRRLTAAKPTTLVETSKKGLAQEVADQLAYLLGSLPAPGAGVAFVNRPRTARAVADHLSQALGRIGVDADIVVLTGQLRDPEADEGRRRLLDSETGAPSGRNPQQPRQRPLAVVATQTLEVGADLDFDVLVSESAGVRALTQRLGRLNRLGERPHGQAVIVHTSDRDQKGLYGEEPAQLWGRLGDLEEPLDLSPGSVATVMGEPKDTPPFIPELLPAHLWEFAKTSLPPPGAAPPEVFYEGLDDADRNVAVFWRAVVPAAGEPLTPAYAQAEAADVPIWEVRQFLQDHQLTPCRVGDDGTVEQAEPGTLRPGDRIVLPATAGGYGSSGWNPDTTDEVLDLSPLLRFTLHLSDDAIANLLNRPPTQDERALLDELALSDEDTPDLAHDTEIGKGILEWLRSTPRPPGAPQDLWPFPDATEPTVLRIGADALPVLTWTVPTPDRIRVRVEALDELSLARRTALADHLEDVGRMAGAIGSHLGFPPALLDAVAQAGRSHDLGKADPRFQRWLGADPGQPVAKSNLPPSAWRSALLRSGWPPGGRHELLSIQLIDPAKPAADHDSDLVRHLVLTHHGHGRPLCPVTLEGDPAVTTVWVEGAPITAETDTRRHQWDQADRFRVLSEQYGYWGLALLETVLRQADHVVSAVSEVQ